MPPEAKNSFNYDELIKCAKGQMFGPGNPQLPLPPMLMCDRITKIDSNGGKFEKGQIVTADSFWAEYSVIQSRDLNRCPDNISLPNLLSLFGIAGLTAYHGLFDVGKAKPSDTVVV